MAKSMFDDPRFSMFGGPMVSTTSGLRPSSTTRGAPNPGGEGTIGPPSRKKRKRPEAGAMPDNQPTPTASGQPVIAPKPDQFRGDLAEAMMARFGQQLPDSRSPWEAIGKGMPYLAAHYRQNQDAKANQKRNQQIAQAIQGADGREALAQALIATGDPRYMQLGVQQRLARPKDNRTADMREYEYARGQGYEGTFSDYQKEMRGAGASRVTVQNKGESAFAKKYSGNIADQVIELGKQATAATDLAQRYQQIENLLNDPDVYTGTGGSALRWIKKTGATLFGQDQFEGLEEAEAAEKTQKLLVGKIREMMGDTRMSDADRQFYSETIPNIDDSPRGIALTVQLAKQVADHKRRAEQKALQIMDQNNGIMTPRGWARFRRWQHRQNIFDPQLMQMARKHAKRTRPRGPAAGFVVEMDGQRYRKNPQTGNWEMLE